MKNLLQGAVKDHRIPQDYKTSWTQPSSSKKFMQDFYRMMKMRMITKNHVHMPIFVFFGVICPYFAVQSYVRLKQTGSLPQTLQPQYYLYRKNLGFYGHQHNIN